MWNSLSLLHIFLYFIFHLNYDLWKTWKRAGRFVWLKSIFERRKVDSSWVSFLHSYIVKHFKPPSKCSLFIVLHLFRARTEEHGNERLRSARSGSMTDSRLTQMASSILIKDPPPSVGHLLSRRVMGMGWGTGPALLHFLCYSERQSSPWL